MSEHFIHKMQKDKWAQQNKHLFDDLNRLVFRLSVHKMKCTDCDFIFLAERSNHHSVRQLNCPICMGDAEHMDDIMVIEEKR